MEKQTGNANMIDHTRHAAAENYISGAYPFKEKRSWQTLIRLARANGNPEILNMAKKQLDGCR